jgi:hypothetical protein
VRGEGRSENRAFVELRDQGINRRAIRCVCTPRVAQKLCEATQEFAGQLRGLPRDVAQQLFKSVEWERGPVCGHSTICARAPPRDTQPS